MKKLILIFMMSAFTPMASLYAFSMEAENVIKVSFDFAGFSKIDGSLDIGGVVYGNDGTLKAEAYDSVSAGFERCYFFRPSNFGFGFGAQYQMPRNIRYANLTIGGVKFDNLQTDGGKLGFVPVYGIIKYTSTPSLETGAFAFVGLQVGYNFMMPDGDFSNMNKDLEGGLYTSFSLGYCYKKIYIEGSYSVNRGKTTLKDDTLDASFNGDLQYGRCSIALGYRF